MTSVSDPVSEILSRLEGVKETGKNQWLAKCPAHTDNKPSLSVSRGDDGKALLYCHAGCAINDICTTLSITEADLFAKDNGQHVKAEIVATYPYRDEQGKVLYEVVRYVPKDFRQRRPVRGGGYSIDQAISDRAQLNTIAFDGLAFLTGDLSCNTFLPPGKVADFCGFQYMRDVDTNELGHNTSFVPRAANNVLYILTDEQKAQLVALAREQEKLVTDFAYKRFPLIKAAAGEGAPGRFSGVGGEAALRRQGQGPPAFPAPGPYRG